MNAEQCLRPRDLQGLQLPCTCAHVCIARPTSWHLHRQDRRSCWGPQSWVGTVFQTTEQRIWEIL